MVFLLENEISLYASHLPLDKHPVVGNNAQLLKILGFDIASPFGFYHGQPISFVGKSKTGISREQIIKELENKLNAECKVLPFGPEKISTIAVCSGGGSIATFMEALYLGVALYLSGDSTEIYHLAKDARMNVIFAGHHATETVGVKALAEIVEKEIGVDTIFVDIPTDL